MAPPGRWDLTLYLDGLGFRSIVRILDFSHVAIYNWMKSFGEQVETLRQKEAIIVEIVMWVIKNYGWIWISVDRLGKRFISILNRNLRHS